MEFMVKACSVKNTVLQKLYVSSTCCFSPLINFLVKGSYSNNSSSCVDLRGLDVSEKVKSSCLDSMYFISRSGCQGHQCMENAMPIRYAIQSFRLIG